MDRKLIDYFPQVLKEVKELKAIVEVEQPEIVSLWIALENALNDQFIEEATENGVIRLENILKIVPKATDTLDERKFKILARFNEQLPYTFRTLEQQLVTLCGDEGYSIELNQAAYTLKVRVALVARKNYDEIDKFLQRTVPANLVIDLSLLYNTNEMLMAFTNKSLEGYTNTALKNEVIN